MFTKKFKVRVKSFSGDKYVVQYAYYRVLPVYTSLSFWFSQTLTGGTECWSINMWAYEQAEKVAEGLTCMVDVQAYYKPYEEERTAFMNAKKKYYEKHVPYASKQIR